MRDVVLAIRPRLASQHAQVMRDRLAAVLVVVNQVDLATHHLIEPDRRRVTYAQVPRRMHQRSAVVGNPTDAGLLACGRQLLGVDRAQCRDIERALKLLRVLLRRHVLGRVGQLRLFDQPCLAGLKRHVQPVVRVSRCLRDLVEVILTAWRADEYRPSFAVGQQRPDDLAPHRRPHVAVLIQHHAVQIQTAQAVRVVSAVQAHPRSVVQLDL